MQLYNYFVFRFLVVTTQLQQNMLYPLHEVLQYTPINIITFPLHAIVQNF
jgi:hypothetical protein